MPHAPHVMLGPTVPRKQRHVPPALLASPVQQQARVSVTRGSTRYWGTVHVMGVQMGHTVLLVHLIAPHVLLGSRKTMIV